MFNDPHTDISILIQHTHIYDMNTCTIALIVLQQTAHFAHTNKCLHGKNTIHISSFNIVCIKGSHKLTSHDRTCTHPQFLL